MKHGNATWWVIGVLLLIASACMPTTLYASFELSDTARAAIAAGGPAGLSVAILVGAVGVHASESVVGQRPKRAALLIAWAVSIVLPLGLSALPWATADGQIPVWLFLVCTVVSGMLGVIAGLTIAQEQTLPRAARSVPLSAVLCMIALSLMRIFAAQLPVTWSAYAVNAIEITMSALMFGVGVFVLQWWARSRWGGAATGADPLELAVAKVEADVAAIAHETELVVTGPIPLNPERPALP